MSHSPEPWKLMTDHKYENWIDDAKGRMTASDLNELCYNGYNNMKRIVACVNACQGVPNELLRPLLAVAKKWVEFKRTYDDYKKLFGS